ncbi:MAG: hypothetical protein NPIRA02_09660 [Nitrospirales bacterium]|nr:MAG: hypothetical protein NPIRA02_09660 [Nitrospirales bacterium]
MTTIEDLKTKAGLLLYRQLPEEYRFLDPREGKELGDLEAFLHGFGHLLDLIRGTTEQAYADAFAESVDLISDSEGNRREIQTWLLPYLAELVGAKLLAPDPKKRVEELNNAVSWFKTKGTLRNIDNIADVVSGAETVLVEGWRRVLLTPRMDLPPFTAPAKARGDGDPLGPPSLPLGIPDFRFTNRAVVDPDGANPLYRLEMSERNADGMMKNEKVKTFWKPRARHGVPCFFGAYDDTAVRTPDLRNPDFPDVGPHPRRNLIHLQPHFGFFEPKLREVALPGGSNPLGFDLTQTDQFQNFGPADILKAIGDPTDANGHLLSPAPDKIVMTGDLTIPSDLLIAFENVLFKGTITVEPNDAGETRLRLSKCAVANLTLGPKGDNPTVEAQDCLFGVIVAPNGFAQLVYCTVLGQTRIQRLWASDCIFAGNVLDLESGEEQTCVRFSSLLDLADLAGCCAEKSPNNTASDPNFIRLYFKDENSCVLRPAQFGEPGSGVLNLTTSRAIREGAEDDGEMGAYHHLYYNAQLRAVKLKLKNFLPLGQEIAIRYDPRLARPAAAVT